ncbi:DUF3179 domain-containing (seleno)protein [Chryseolinea sp. T2]|uniref:DUF3179 domain-containing (seleno)protein n=1 Tax=Chryseolinea sp. T2 TaxID=3129255 RepID=UPI003077B7E1
MKRTLFYSGVVFLILFEILKVYFIMPMPGSQQHDTLDVAYFLHSYRWVFRMIFLAFIVFGAQDAFRIKHKWLPVLPIVALLFVAYTFNFKMMADKMFEQPKNLSFKDRTGNILTDSSIVIGVSLNGEAKAYPIRYMSYHHQVRDTVGGKAMIITYCNVCRTGRVFEPVVEGKGETFRLVGMDHFNAMFEDETTKSWWRQATGEAVAGPLKGKSLPEVGAAQMSLRKWFELNPGGVVMQYDPTFRSVYDSTGRFEKGRGRSSLTRTDSSSWEDKSWVVGVSINGESKAYDWNQLRDQRIINDIVGNVPIVMALASDNMSFMVFERPTSGHQFTVSGDTLSAEKLQYDFSGRDLSSLTGHLPAIKAYQEFWHSWRTFHPNTKRYDVSKSESNTTL